MTLRMQSILLKLVAVVLAIIGLFPGIRFVYLWNFTSDLARDQREYPWLPVQYLKFGLIAAASLCIAYLLFRLSLQKNVSHRDPPC